VILVKVIAWSVLVGLRNWWRGVIKPSWTIGMIMWPLSLGIWAIVCVLFAHKYPEIGPFGLLVGAFAAYVGVAVANVWWLHGVTVVKRNSVLLDKNHAELFRTSRWDMTLWGAKELFPGYVRQINCDAGFVSHYIGDMVITIRWGGTPETFLPMYRAAFRENLGIRDWVTLMLHHRTLGMQPGDVSKRSERAAFRQAVKQKFADLPDGSTIAVDLSGYRTREPEELAPEPAAA
jgi:hypothetical protein